MMIENIFPFLYWNRIPTNDEDAAKRICELGGGSLLTAPLTRITGQLFTDLRQLKKALIECKFNIFKDKLIEKQGPVTIVCLQVINSSQTIYNVWATEYRDKYVEVNLVKMIQSRGETAEDVAAFKAAINGETEEKED